MVNRTRVQFVAFFLVHAQSVEIIGLVRLATLR